MATPTCPWTSIKQILVIACGLLWCTVAQAVLDIPGTPLFLTITGVKPNIILTLDDSGSMRRAYVPERCGDTSDCISLDNRWAKAIEGNALYYDPRATYAPPKKADGTTRATSFTAAWRNGYYTSGTVNGVNFGTPVNLSTSYRPTAYLDMETNPPEGFSNREKQSTGSTTGSSGSPPASFTITDFENADGSGTPGNNILVITVNNQVQTRVGSAGSLSCTTRPTSNNQYTTYLSGSTLRLCFRNNSTMQNKPITVIYKKTDGGPAYYTVFDYTKPGCTGTAAEMIFNNYCYDTRYVSSTSGPGGSDERQNFANWYSFYRTRSHATVSGASIAFSGLGNDSRVAWQALNTCRGSTTSLVTSNCSGWDGVSRGSNAINWFTGTKKSSFFDWLARLPTSGGTPLRQGTTRVGSYLQTAGENSPYDNDFSTSSSGEHSCRRSFHILMTDGVWNDDVTLGNLDNTSVTHLPDEGSDNPIDPLGTPYSTSAGYATIFKDSYYDTLADVAFKYWATDLRSTLPDNVPQYITDRSGTDLTKFWNPKNDSASWQHLVNFMVGLGLTDYMAASGLTWGGDTYSGSYASLVAGPTYGGIAWPAATAAMGVDGPDYGKSAHDLWHAAINSRGKFYSVELSGQIAAAFQDIIDTITSVADSGGGAGLGSNTIQIEQQGALVYEAKFNADWSGRILARPIQSNGTLGNEYWDAGQSIPPPYARNVLTLNTSPEPFTTCAGDLQASLNLSPSGEVDGLCAKRLNWLRGDGKVENATWAHFNASTNKVTATFTVRGHGFVTGDTLSISGVAVTEVPPPALSYNGNFTITVTGTDTFTALVPSTVTGLGTFRAPSSTSERWGRARYTQFRNRPISVLGDIVDSDPVYAHKEDFGFGSGGSQLSGKETYQAFVGSKSARPPMLYEGANDGMLHGFNADIAGSGAELFAYVPHGVYANLSKLTDPLYTHTYYVNGQIHVSDAYLDGAWGTYVVAGLGAGGKTVFALDVSDPAAFTAADVKWEFSDPTDLGLTYSKPLIAPVSQNQWAVVFGNGYNSSSDRAYLYLVDLADATPIAKIATNTAVNNGLSTPYLYDSNGDQVIDQIYAGDLQGNLWKFERSGGSWGLGNGGNPLFVARNAAGEVQPITSQPKVASHPQGGVLVYFGTGRYLTTDDLANDDQQAFYAIWDKANTTGTVNRNQLQGYSILVETTVSGRQVRTTSAGTVNWTTQRGWYLNLPNTPNVPAERVVSTPLVMEFVDPSVPDRILFVTNTPASDPCGRGGITWLMELDLISGGYTLSSSGTPTSVFDLNGDGVFDDADLVGGVSVSGIAVNATYGLTGEPLLLKNASGHIIKEFAGSSGESGTGGVPLQKGEPPRPMDVPIRLYWKQIL